MDEASLAPCGVLCELCLAFQRPKNSCVGCRAEGDKPYHCTVCSVKGCAEKRGDPSAPCGECPKFPCRRIKDLDKRYREKYGMSFRENIEAAGRDGAAAFVEAARLQWSCPACGELLCVHTGSCLRCGASNPYFPVRG